MAAFLASPVWGAILAITGTVFIALFGFLWRLSSKIDIIGDQVSELKEDISNLRSDQNIVRWSDLRVFKPRRRRRVI